MLLKESYGTVSPKDKNYPFLFFFFCGPAFPILLSAIHIVMIQVIAKKSLNNMKICIFPMPYVNYENVFSVRFRIKKYFLDSRCYKWLL